MCVVVISQRFEPLEHYHHAHKTNHTMCIYKLERNLYIDCPSQICFLFHCVDRKSKIADNAWHGLIYT
jgi:hypothetical protein